MSYKEFQIGRTTIEDSGRCGQPMTVATVQNVVKVECLIKEDPRVTESELTDDFNLSSGSLSRNPLSSPGCLEALSPFGVPPADRGTKDGYG